MKNNISSGLQTTSLKKKAVKGAGINIINQLISFIFHTAGVIILARLLSPRDFGLVAMVTAFSLWIMNFGINGFTEYIIQKRDIDYLEIDSIFWSHLFLAFVFSVCFIVSSSLLVHFYKELHLRNIAIAMSSSFILCALYTCHFALLKREMKFAYVSFIEMIALVVGVVFSIVAAINGLGYWAVVIRQLTVPIITAIGAWLLNPWRPHFIHNISKTIPALKYAMKVYCNFSLGYVTRNIDKIILGKFHGSEILGSYDRAYYLSTFPSTQLLFPLNNVALATLSRLKDDKYIYTSYYIKAVSALSLLGTLFALVLMLTAKDLILLLLGPAWKEAGFVLMSLSPGISALLVYGTHTWLHLSLGTPGRWLRWNIFATIITICAFFIAVQYGAIAMGIAYSARSYILLVPSLWYAGRPVELDVRRILTVILPYFSSAFIIATLWIYSSNQLTFVKDYISQINIISRTFLICTGASILYFLLIFIMQRSFKSAREIISIIYLFFKRGSD